MIEELNQTGEFVLLPIIPPPKPKVTTYYDYTKSHKHKLLINELYDELKREEMEEIEEVKEQSQRKEEVLSGFNRIKRIKRRSKER